MKKLIVILLLAPVAAFAQKALKPNTNKILSLYQDKKYREAKEQADITVADPKSSTDGKAWYYRGLVYATLDTIQDKSLNGLDPNPLKVAVESFQKGDQLNKKKDNDYFIMNKGDYTPISKSVQLEQLANYYLDKSIKLIQADEPDYLGSYVRAASARNVFENAGLNKYSNDTLTYYIQSLAALYAQRYDSAIEASDKYFAKGGKSVDMYLIQFQVYNERKDYVKAAEVIKNGRMLYPNHESLIKNELNIYLASEKYDEAKKMVQDLVKKDPSADNYYLLGQLNQELNNDAEAEAAHRKALSIDPENFNANAAIAEITYKLVGKTRAERDATKDNAKRQQLYQKIGQQLKDSVPYWEKLEALKPHEENVLYGLQSIYNDLTTYDEATYGPKLKRLKGKMKAMGLEVD